MDLGRAADRLAVGDRGRAGGDRGAELALEPLADDGDVRLADRAQDLLAGLGPLDPGGGLLLEHPLERRAHLVEVALGHGVDGHLQGRLRKVDRRQPEAGVARRQRVAGLGHAELGDRADLARPQLRRRLLLLAVEVQQLADPLVLALRGVVRGALALERPGQDAQVGQPPDERVGGGLEHADQQLPAVGLDPDVLAGLVGGREGALFLGRGQVADDRVEERVEPDPLGRRRDEDRGEDRLAHALVEARVELGVGHLLLAEVLLEHGVVRLGRGLEELVTTPRHLVGELCRDRDLDLLAALEPVRLAVDEVDIAAERLGRADRQVERRDLRPERRAQGVERRARVRVLAVALVEHEACRRAGGAPGLDRGLEPGVDPAGGVDHEQGRVGRVEALDHLADEVGVAGRVDEGDLVLAVLERPDGEAQRTALLLLLGLVVEVGRSVIDTAQARDRAGSKEHLLREGGLAAPGMSGEHDAPDVGEVVTLQRHRARFLRWFPVGRVPAATGRCAGALARCGDSSPGGRRCGSVGRSPGLIPR